MAQPEAAHTGHANGGTNQPAALADSVASTFEWLITAFILAFVFRAFVMEAFRIPTGSMADTLKGAHFRICCPQCGYRYDYNYQISENPPTYDLAIKPGTPRCPSCGYFFPPGLKAQAANGDRILVLKCIYQFKEPRQWDVVVFRNPIDPRQNYIKRMIARAGETVEIIDGDVYINGLISRKPPKVQEELWVPVFDNDYQPVRPAEGRFNGHSWQQPFRNLSGSLWNLSVDNPTVFSLDSPEQQVNAMFYDTKIGNNFQAGLPYNPQEYHKLPYSSDLMARFAVDPQGDQGGAGAALSKYGVFYKAWVDFAGRMVIGKQVDGETVELAKRTIAPLPAGKAVAVSFANVDHKLIFEVADKKLVVDLGRDPNAIGERKTEIEPGVTILGAGKLNLSHLAIYRDEYYLSEGVGEKISRAGEGNPFTLAKGEYFVCGDNSPASFDSRWWNREGVGNDGRSFREGIVPKEYLVGKAYFVYWPGGFKPTPALGLSIIPNVGQMRFIYGGAN